MFEKFYGLTGRPFQLTPDPRFYFDARTHHKAMAYLTYGLSQEEGFIIITGEIGTGKTTLVGHLLSQLDPQEFIVAQVVSTQLNAAELLHAIAEEFGLETEGKDKARLLREIERFLKKTHQEGKRVLLVIDEAQNLPVSALEELRMLSNFQVDGHPLLQCFLLGQPEFRERLFQAPVLEQLRQRVIATHHLEPISRNEIKGYIEHRLSLVGWKGDPRFTEDAYDRIYSYTGGIPRRVNALCSRILLFGALEELHEIDAAVVEDVIQDLEADNIFQSASGLERQRPLAERTPVGEDAPAVAGAPADVRMVEDGMLADLDRRITVLEHYVRRHDETLRALLIALGREDEAAALAADPADAPAAGTAGEENGSDAGADGDADAGGETAPKKESGKAGRARGAGRTSSAG